MAVGLGRRGGLLRELRKMLSHGPARPIEFEAKYARVERHQEREARRSDPAGDDPCGRHVRSHQQQRYRNPEPATKGRRRYTRQGFPCDRCRVEWRPAPDACVRFCCGHAAQLLPCNRREAVQTDPHRTRAPPGRRRVPHQARAAARQGHAFRRMGGRRPWAQSGTKSSNRCLRTPRRSGRAHRLPPANRDQSSRCQKAARGPRQPWEGPAGWRPPPETTCRASSWTRV